MKKNILPLTPWAYFDTLIYNYALDETTTVPIYQAAKADTSIDFEIYEND
jgi:hypothetical protein